MLVVLVSQRMLPFLLALSKKLGLTLGASWNPKVSSVFLHTFNSNLKGLPTLPHSTLCLHKLGAHSRQNRRDVYNMACTLDTQAKKTTNHDALWFLFLVPEHVTRPGKGRRSLGWCVEQSHWCLRLKMLHRADFAEITFWLLLWGFAAAEAEATVSRKCYIVAAMQSIWGQACCTCVTLGKKPVWPG